MRKRAELCDRLGAEPEQPVAEEFRRDAVLSVVLVDLPQQRVVARLHPLLECDDRRAAFPDLGFEGTADLIAEGDYVVGQWIGGGTQAGDAFDDMPMGGLPAGTGKTMRFTGITILKV